jgi:hypothetical protein
MAVAVAVALTLMVRLVEQAELVVVVRVVLEVTPMRTVELLERQTLVVVVVVLVVQQTHTQLLTLVVVVLVMS